MHLTQSLVQPYIVLAVEVEVALLSVVVQQVKLVVMVVVAQVELLVQVQQVRLTQAAAAAVLAVTDLEHTLVVLVAQV